MKFRPCIDIHNGKVKQIVGGSLKDAAFYAELYKKAGLKGGHVILLNGRIPRTMKRRKPRHFRLWENIPEGFRSEAASARRMRQNIWRLAPAT